MGRSAALMVVAALALAGCGLATGEIGVENTTTTVPVPGGAAAPGAAGRDRPDDSSGSSTTAVVKVLPEGWCRSINRVLVTPVDRTSVPEILGQVDDFEAALEQAVAEGPPDIASVAETLIPVAQRLHGEISQMDEAGRAADRLNETFQAHQQEIATLVQTGGLYCGDTGSEVIYEP